VELRPETRTNAGALRKLIDTAYSDIKARVENGQGERFRSERVSLSSDYPSARVNRVPWRGEATR
jgi:hypothetical protein